MKRIRAFAKIAGVVMAAIITSLVITIVCSPKEGRLDVSQTIEEFLDQEESGRQIEWDSLPAEVVAWIEVPGTNIDEPIVQATPDAPNAYLYCNVFGQGNYGTPYIDCECSLASNFVMVYGHHMSDGSVFADFASFSDEAYAREHSRIIIYKRSGETLELKIFAVDIVDANNERIRIDKSETISEMTENVDLLLDQPSEAAQLFAFATCSYQTSNTCTVVYATLKQTINADGS